MCELLLEAAYGKKLQVVLRTIITRENMYLLNGIDCTLLSAAYGKTPVGASNISRISVIYAIECPY